VPEPFTLEQVQAFCDKHSLRGEVRHIGSGYINWVYQVGDDIIIRATKQGMDPEDSYTEIVAVPAAIKAGIKTPELLLFDDDCDALPTVTTVYRRCEGVALATLQVDQHELPPLYRELGREIAKLHTRVTEVDDPNNWLDKLYRYDLDEEIQKAFAANKIETVTRDWLMKWADRLRPAHESPFETKFVHNDMHAGNTMVLQDPLRLSAIIDWGDANWGDPAQDVLKTPVWAAPWVIEGYRQEGGEVDEMFVGRVIAQNVAISLVGLYDKWPEGDLAWQPLASSFWANLVRLTAMDLPSEWKRWLPDAPV